MTRLAVVLSIIGISLCAASTATAARSEFFGIVQGQRFDLQDLQRLGTAKIRTERHLLNWSAVQPSQGSFDWDVTDRFIGRLASHGVRSMPFVWGNPGWVAGSQATPPLESTADRQAWRDFLKAAVARYGPGGSYWANGYVQQFGADATPLPIQSWQIWNEPNLAKFFAPSPSPAKYAQLLQISSAAIKSQDPHAQIVLAGMVGYTDHKAWDFLDDLYRVGAVKGSFDVAALHPYGSELERVQNAFQQFRRVMNDHNDGQTPLWVTEIGWGSKPPDGFGINKGIEGQERLLRRSFQLVLDNRSAWNVQRLFWFFWRDPATHTPGTCSFCSSAGLLRHNHNAKPAYHTFRGFTAETNPPQATITAGPSPGVFTSNPRTGFRFVSNEPGSTFECRIDAGSFETCSSPHRPPPFSDGTHTFSVRAIDAPGNVSVVRSRSFTVDTTVPVATISSGPADGSISSNPSPSFDFDSSESAASLSCQLDGGGFHPCSSPFGASGLADGSHTFRVRATDAAHNVGGASRTWIVDTTAPTVTITSGPANGSISSQRSQPFSFTSGEPDVSFECRLGGGAPRDCSSPFAASSLADGSYTFQVTATDAADNTATESRTWTVDGPAEVSIRAGPTSGSVGKDRTPSFAFSSLDTDSGFSCRVDAAAFRPCTSPFTTSALADGRHTVRVRATDDAQRTDVDWRWFRVDTAAPAVKIKGERRVKTRKRRASATFILKPSERAGLRCRIDSRRFKPCSRRYRTPKLHRGTHRLKVKATDRAGNARTKGKTFKIVRR